MHNRPRVLVVMRHAKAESFAHSDHQRRLDAGGRRDAAATGTWLAHQQVRVDYALVSSAARAVATWEAVAEAAAWEVTTAVDDTLYDAGTDTALDVIRGIPADVEGLIVVGHNPTMSSLAQLLDSGEGDPSAATELSRGFPAGAVTVFEFIGSWSDLDLGGARLTRFHAVDA